MNKIFAFVVLLLMAVPLEAGETEVKGGYVSTVIALDTLVAADTTEGNFLELFGEFLTGDAFFDWQVTNLANNTKYKIYYLYGNDTLVMADTVMIDSLQAEKNGSLKHRLKPASYYKFYAITFGSGNDSVTVRLGVNFIPIRHFNP